LPVANGGTGHSALIAFACRRNPSSGDVSLNDDIVFNNVQVNIGSAYNNSNGRFTAPVAGTYLFSFYAIGCGASAGELPANQTVMGYFKKMVQMLGMDGFNQGELHLVIQILLEQ
jgi:outer membrane protease